jgi:hypothetical protein
MLLLSRQIAAYRNSGPKEKQYLLEQERCPVSAVCDDHWMKMEVENWKKEIE